MTEHPTSHEGRQPLAARPQERARPRQEAAPGLPSDVPAQPGGPTVPGQEAPAQDAPGAVAVAVSPQPPGGDGLARREGDRLRFVGAATRRIARGIDLDEIVLGLCRATVPTFSDEILVYLRDPLPVGDERPVAPFVLRLRRSDRLRLSDAEGEELVLVPDPDPTPAAELCEVRGGGALAEVLRGVRPVFGDSAAAKAALAELLGPEHPQPGGLRA
ncbi:serine/threonine protein phosphatase, partial [Streptomyces sp. NPDC004290]